MGTINQSNGRIRIDDLLQRDLRFRYQLLGRLQSDCEYYLHYGNRCMSCLWAGDEVLQIETMKKLYDSFKEDEKPEWLTLDDIMEYGRRMITEK